MNILRVFLGLSAIALGSAYAVTPAAAQNSAPGITLRPPGSAATTPTAAPAAPSPDALREAQNFVSIVSASMTSDFTNKVMTQYWPAIESALRTRNPNIDETTISELRAEFERLMVGGVSEMIKDVPVLYVHYFTVQEMRDMEAFYRTPTGAKALMVMPQVMDGLLAAMTPRLNALQEKVGLAFLNVLQKHGYLAQ